MQRGWLFFKAQGGDRALTDFQAAYSAEEGRAREAFKRRPDIRRAELIAAGVHVLRVCVNALLVFPPAFGALALLAVSGWSLDGAMQTLHQVYYAQPAEQQQAMQEGIARAWALLAVMFVAFDMAVADVLTSARPSPLDRAVALHMEQWEGRYVARALGELRQENN